MGWFSGSGPDPEKLRAVAERISPVLLAYSHAFEAHAGSEYPLAISELPFPKTTINDALFEWLTLLLNKGTAQKLRTLDNEFYDAFGSGEAIDWLLVQ